MVSVSMMNAVCRNVLEETLGYVAQRRMPVAPA